MTVEPEEGLWFHGRLKRDVAENKLMSCSSSLASFDPNGIFLVRESSCNSGEYILSVLEHDNISHYQIRRHYNDAFFSVNDVDVFHGLETLISHYINLNRNSLKLTMPCPGGTTPPLEACRNGKSSLLHRATCQGNSLIVQEILKSKSGSLNSKDQDGRTVAHLACMHGFKSVLDLLVDCEHVNCNVKDIAGLTPLHYACRHNRPEFVALLLENGKANPQTRSTDKNWVALHEAVFHNAKECVCVLLHYGAAVHPRSLSNKTPLDIARSKQLLECEALLDSYCCHDGSDLLLKQPWYFPNINDRKKSQEVLLKDGKIDGAFIVRASSKNTNISVLSVYYHNQFYHFEIQFQNSMYSIDYGPYFESLEKLVTHYSRWDDGLPCVLNPHHLILKIQANTKLSLEGSESPASVSKAAQSKQNETENNSLLLRKIIKQTGIGALKIDRDTLVLESVIGEGEFGCVHQGRWVFDQNRSIAVAVKQLHENQLGSVKEQFLQEAKLMGELDHVCIVKLYGVVSGPPLLMVQELMPMGSLLDFVVNNKSSVSLSDVRLWSAQIATGMAYLESCRFVHRDLACRNILLLSLSQAKISDFGLSRVLQEDNQCYRASQGGRWPVKWYAPESINYGTFSHKSDVWSFGITLWEIFSLGEEPYGDILGSELPRLLEQGYRMTMPELCPFGTYEKMKQCWCKSPEDRPSFVELREFFSSDPEYSNVQTLIDLSNINVHADKQSF